MSQTRVKVTYIAMDSDGNKPIMSADTFDNLRKGLDEYYGVEKLNAECLGFYPYITKYPDYFEGHYMYKWNMLIRDVVEEYVDTIKVYCVDYYPNTIYQID